MKKFIGIMMLCVLCACAGSHQNSLRGHEYVATIEKTKIIMIFDENENRVHGKVVNTFIAPYDINGDVIIFSHIAATLMMPIGSAAEVEQKFFNFLNNGDPKHFETLGNKMTLSDNSGGKWVFERVK